MKRAKLIFRLQRDEDGYPPVDFEGLWVQLIGDDMGTIDNIPFFCRDVALGDVVKFERIGDELRYVSTVKRSGNSLIRVVYYPPADPAELRRRIEEFGCETELNASHSLIAVSIPVETDLVSVQEFLASGEKRGELGYEEPILIRRN